jgi:hypothetical protein
MESLANRMYRAGPPAVPEPAWTRIQDAMGRVPGLSVAVSGVLRVTDKAVTVSGEHHGTSAVAKVLLTDDPYWRARFTHEAALYQVFERHPPPFTAPRLYHADHALLIIQRLSGQAVHPDRYPSALPGSTVEAMLAGLTAFGSWQPPPELAMPPFDLMSWLARETAAGTMTVADADRVLAILRRQPTRFAHADPLASNAIHHKGTVTWVDFEHSGLLPPGADEALLAVLLGHHDLQAARRCEEQALAAGSAGSYTAMRALWLARERRLHQQVFPGTHDALTTWLAEETALVSGQLVKMGRI